jgi:uncharacterized membrane protein YqjE
MSLFDGLILSARRLLGTVLELAQVRLELLATEIELEKQRLLEALWISFLSLFALGLGVVLLFVCLVLVVAERYRVPLLAALSLLCLAGGAWGLHAARHRLTRGGGLFHGSLAELARDRAQIAPDE